MDLGVSRAGALYLFGTFVGLKICTMSSSKTCELWKGEENWWEYLRIHVCRVHAYTMSVPHYATRLFRYVGLDACASAHMDVCLT